MDTLRLVLLPGMDGTGLLFEPLLQALSARLIPQVVAYPGREPLGYAELAEFVAAVLLCNGAPPCSLPRTRPCSLVSRTIST